MGELTLRECLYYWLVEPLGRSFRDEAGSVPAFEVPIETKTGTVYFAVFLDEHRLPAYARLRFPCGHEDHITEDRLPLIQSVKEHFLSVLRLEFSEDAYLFPRPIWAFIDTGAQFSIGLDITVIEPTLAFDPEVFRRMFSSSFKQREEVRLLLDGSDKRIPLQYRFLSLYRLLELLLRPDRQWKKEDLERAFVPYAERVNDAGFSRSPVNALHELRDSCTHIRNGGEFGVTHLNLGQAARIEKFLPILIDVCIALLNSRFAPSLSFGRGPKSIA